MTDDNWRPSASRQVLARRAALFAQTRAFFAERDVLEVDTPVLSQGAASEPQLASFALRDSSGDGTRRHLISSPEFAMKRLLAAGSGAVYRLGPAFRAGEIGRWHNPEFCMLEWYRPGLGYRQLMQEVADLFAALAPQAPEIQQRSVAQVFADSVGLDPHTTGVEQLRGAAQQRGWAPADCPPDSDPRARAFWLDLILGLGTVDALADGAVMIYDYPACMAMLTQVRAGPTPVAERFELYWRGVELANGGNELLDPDTLRRRFEADRATRALSGESTAVGDARLVAAQRHGLPPCAGVALGLDRLLALILGLDSIAPVLPFDWARA